MLAVERQAHGLEQVVSLDGFLEHRVYAVGRIGRSFVIDPARNDDDRYLIAAVA